MKDIIIENDNIINSTDFESKAKDIIEKLGNSVFMNINQEDTFDYDDEGNPKKKKKYNKNEIMPMITPTIVDIKLSQLMRVYKPMNIQEAKTLTDSDYLLAFQYYCDIMLYINKYVVYLPDKQTYCAFCNITDDIYNEFLQDTEYMQVFKGIDNTFIHSNFNASQSGLADNKTILTKLQTKDSGYNLVKNPEAIVFNDNRSINLEKLESDAEKFRAMLLPNRK